MDGLPSRSCCTHACLTLVKHRITDLLYKMLQRRASPVAVCSRIDEIRTTSARFFAGWDSDSRRSGLGVAKANRRDGIGWGVGVGKDSRSVSRKLDRGADRKEGAVASGGKPRHDLAVFDRQGNGPGMGNQNHRRHRRAGRLGAEGHRPGQQRQPGPFQDIRDRDLRMRAGQGRARGRIQTRRDRRDAIQVGDAIDPNVPGAALGLSRSGFGLRTESAAEPDCRFGRAWSSGSVSVQQSWRS